MEKQKKSGFIALVGRPNVGKSTLMNHLIGQKIAITSRKPQTTRNQIRTVYTDERGQAVFLDTPGIHKAQNRLGTYMVEVAQKTFSQADIVMWLVEPTTFIGRGEQEIAKKLRQLKCPVFLIVNKTDTVKKEAVAECIKAYRQIADFNEVVAVSALRSVNTDTLLDTVFRYLPYGPMYYDEDTVTDQPMRQIAAEMIREKALRRLQEEIPHGIAVTIEQMKERPDGSVMDIEASIICERESHKGIIIGKGGSMLKAIGSDEFVAKNMGINVNKYKVLAFILSGAFLGVMAILTISYGSSMVAVTGMASMSRNFVPTMGCFFGLAFKKYGMPLPAIIIGEFVINIIFFGFIALGAPTAIQDVITGLALLIIITVTTKATKGEIVK